MKTKMTDDEQFEQLMGLVTEYYKTVKNINRIVKRIVNPPKSTLKKLKNKQLRLETKISNLKENGEN